jgi:hypothetical protein
VTRITGGLRHVCSVVQLLSSTRSPATRVASQSSQLLAPTNSSIVLFSFGVRWSSRSPRSCSNLTAANAACSRAARTLSAQRPVTSRRPQKRGRCAVAWYTTRLRHGSHTRSVTKHGRSAVGSFAASPANLRRRATVARAASASQPHLTSARHEVSAEQYLRVCVTP